MALHVRDEPEAKPVVVTTIAAQHPTVVRIGNQGSASTDDLRKPLKAWVGNLDGEVRIYDASSFGCGPGGAERECDNFEFGGKFDLPGTPFHVGTSNVN